MGNIQILMYDLAMWVSYSFSKVGFTMIEMLVVISIIGVLASIVLVPLNNARNRGKDASAKTTMSDIRVYADVFFTNHGYSYANLCDGVTDPEVGKLLQAVQNQTGNPAVCNPSASNYAVWVKLRSDQYFCVDNEGFAGEVGAIEPPAGSTVCP